MFNAQLSMKFILLVNADMSIIGGIVLLMSKIDNRLYE